MNVLFCSSEVFPFAKTGGLADVCGTLPAALQENGINVKVVMPKYKGITQKKFGLKAAGEGFFKTTRDGVDTYFVENKKYFYRNGLYGNAKGDYKDNLSRFIYFCRRVFDLIREENLRPDILHCHDWQTALIPVYLKELEGTDPGLKSVLTVHNLAFQGQFPADDYSLLGLRDELFNINGFEYHGDLNLFKAGLLYADSVTTVSPNYAREIQTPENGCGLDGVLRSRRDTVEGILNGLDYDYWNPKNDAYLKYRYDVSSWQKGKRRNKQDLQKELKVNVKDDVPLFGFVGRLSEQKGIHLILEAMQAMKKEDAQFVVLGLGETRMTRKLKSLSRGKDSSVRFINDFDEKTAHRIYAASDFYLMPSRFEPCGLAQMISMAYGTIPICFRTGGLAETVTDCEKNKKKGNGLLFGRYEAASLVKKVKKAMKIFADEATRRRVIENAMKTRFEWRESARKYKELYQCVLSA